MSIKTRFEKEATGNSEMVYWTEKQNRMFMQITNSRKKQRRMICNFVFRENNFYQLIDVRANVLSLRSNEGLTLETVSYTHLTLPTKLEV